MIEVVWLEQYEADVPEGGNWLSESDAGRLQAMRFPKRRADSRLGRWTAKTALGIYLKVEDLAAIEIRPTAGGVPEVFIADEPAEVAISLSHRAGVSMCAIAPRGTAMGCDLELIEPRSVAFVADYFTGEEQDFVARAPGEERPRILALLWSAKESALKALQEGLRLDTRSVEVSLDDRAFDAAEGVGEWLPLRVQYVPREGNAESRCFDGWWQHTGKYVRTLVADPPPAVPVRLQLARSANPLIARPG
jgi:4'-phosphopantetheinyl transferase